MPTEPDDNGDGHVDGFDEEEGFDEADLVTIVHDDGTEIDCAIVMVIEHEGEEYALLARLEQLESEDGDEVEMFIFHSAVDDEGKTVLTAVEDDDTYDVLEKEFSVLMEQG